MCGACGILQHDGDWTEGFGQVPSDAAWHHERLAERRRRLALVNELLGPAGLRLHEQGRQLVLRNQTGKSVVVGSLAHVWREADRLGRYPVDPLHPESRS